MSSQQGQPDTMWTMIWAVVVGTLACVIFWHYFKMPILEGLRYLRLGELWIVSLFTSQQDACIQWLRYAHFEENPNPSQDMIRLTNGCFGASYLAQVPAADNPRYFTLSGTALSVIGTRAAYYYRWLFLVIFVAVAVYSAFFSHRTKFRTKHNLESFIRVQAKMWPVISPIVNFDPIKSSARVPGTMVPDKLPMFAEALSPEEWIAFHRISVVNGIADREATRRAFLLQLGPRWNKTMEGQPPYLQALFAVFSLKGNQKREESDAFLGELALCWSVKGGFKMNAKTEATVRRLLQDKEVGGKGMEIANQYAYRTTAMIGVLRWARSMGGVLAPAQFLWLRGTDRNLWYALNNLGRRSFHTEGAGAMAHFMVEQAAQKPLPIPRIDTAIVTLNKYLAESGQAIPPREGDVSREAT